MNPPIISRELVESKYSSIQKATVSDITELIIGPKHKNKRRTWLNTRRAVARTSNSLMKWGILDRESNGNGTYVYKLKGDEKHG